MWTFYNSLTLSWWLFASLDEASSNNKQQNFEIQLKFSVLKSNGGRCVCMDGWMDGWIPNVFQRGPDLTMWKWPMAPPETFKTMKVKYNSSYLTNWFAMTQQLSFFLFSFLHENVILPFKMLTCHIFIHIFKTLRTKNLFISNAQNTGNWH